MAGYGQDPCGKYLRGGKRLPKHAEVILLGFRNCASPALEIVWCDARNSRYPIKGRSAVWRWLANQARTTAANRDRSSRFLRL
jgi:hypothetical protein